jgi:RNA recognition motif-containing protein
VQDFGEITNTKIMRDANTKASRGFGFVLFAEGADAAKAVAEMNDVTLDGKKLYVALAQPKAARAAQMQDSMKGGMLPGPMVPFAAGGRMNPMAQGMQVRFVCSLELLSCASVHAARSAWQLPPKRT